MNSEHWFMLGPSIQVGICVHSLSREPFRLQTRQRLQCQHAVSSFGAYRDVFPLTFSRRRTKLPLEQDKAFLLCLPHGGFQTPCTSGVTKLIHVHLRSLRGVSTTTFGDERTKAIVFWAQSCWGLRQRRLSRRVVRFITCEALDLDSGGPPGGRVWWRWSSKKIIYLFILFF